MKPATHRLTPAALRMIDGLPDDLLVYHLALLRWTAKGLGTGVPSRARLYTPTQFKVYQRLQAQIRREKRTGAR